MKDNNKFLDLLVSEGIIEENALKNLTQKYQNNSFDILMHLVEEKPADKNKLGILWGNSIGIAYVDPNKALFQTDIVERLPEDFARKNKVIPIYQFGQGISIATSNPTNSVILNKLEQVLGHQVSPMFAFPDDIDAAIEEQYGTGQSLGDLAKKLSVSSDQKDKDKTKENTKSKENIKLTDIPESDDLEKNFYNSKNISKNIDPRKAEHESVISETTKKHLVNTTKNIFNDALNNRIPKIEACQEVRNVILEEVHNKVDVIFCIRQLRIKDEQTYAHTVNVTLMSSVIGKMFGLSPNVLKELALGALLHDIGKIRVPQKILYKTGRLTPEEAALIKKHPILGHQITKMMELPDRITDVVLHHHERIDGMGYPSGLKENDISLNTQLVSIVDVYDSLLTGGFSKKELSHHEAMNIMLIEGQKAFSSKILYNFVKMSYNQDMGHIKNTFRSVLYGEF